MSDLDNARYRLLSFKYTPTKPVTGDSTSAANDKAADKAADSVDDHDDTQAGTKPPSKDKESELPSLSSLAEALPALDTTPPPEKNQAMAVSDTPDPHPATAPAPDAEESAAASDKGLPAPIFHLFGDLPPELRIKIWHLTFLPRVVELHPTRPNYARDTGRQQQWQSGCSNPAALSVSSEARQIGLAHFRIAYSLASIVSQQEENSPSAPFSRYGPAADSFAGMYNFRGPSATGKASLRRRTLHISPSDDTVALLGQDTDFAKLSGLLESLRAADPLGVGISNLALSTRGWGYGGSAAMMRSLNRTVLRDIGQLTLFMYGEPLPPPEWNVRGASLDEESLRKFREFGNRCELVRCEGSNAWYAYRLWSGGKGRQFWDDEGKIMRVGRNELRIMDLKFSDGW